MGGNVFSNRGLFDARGAARPSASSARAPTRRREMPIIGADEAQHYANVASLPCMLQDCACGGSSGTTVAHSNQLKDGKARGLKSPWWMVAALCAGAHYRIDHGRELSKAARRALWDEAHRRTTAELFARGLLRPVVHVEGAER